VAKVRVSETVNIAIRTECRAVLINVIICS
jgi:hypothetical protein